MKDLSLDEVAHIRNLLDIVERTAASRLPGLGSIHAHAMDALKSIAEDFAKAQAKAAELLQQAKTIPSGAPSLGAPTTVNKTESANAS